MTRFRQQIIELEKVRRYAESIVETIHEPLLVLNADLKVHSANKSFYDIFKVTQEETTGVFVYDIGNHQWDIPVLRKLLEEILPKEKTFENYEVGHNFPTIGQRIMLLNARQIYQENIGSGLILLAIEDITEHKKAEEELRRYRQNLEEARRYAESIVETIHEPLLVLNADLKVLSANKSFYDIFKVTPEETIGVFVYDIGNHQWDIPLLRKLLEEIIPKENTFENYEVGHDFPTIGQRIMLLNARQIYQENIGSGLILLAIEDITERKKAEEELGKYRHRLEELVEERTTELKLANEKLQQNIIKLKQIEKDLKQSEERYRRLFETSKDGLLLLDKLTGHIIKVNPAIVELLGYPVEEFSGKKLKDIGLLENIENFRNTIQELNKNGFIHYDAVPVKTKEGKNIVTEIFLVDRTGVIHCNVRDLTWRKKVEEELVKYREHLEKLVKERTNELEKKNEELEKFNRVFVGRELRMAELKKTIAEYEKKIAQFENEIFNEQK